MAKHFPSDMLLAASQNGMKLILFSDIVPSGLQDCINCGGIGFFNVFFATEGPYQQPAAPYRSDGKISHWHNDRWWVGKSYNFTCPDCQGEGMTNIPREPARYEPSEPEFDNPFEQERQSAFDTGERF